MTSQFQISGTYRQCRQCRAPITPGPSGSLDLIKEGPATGPARAFITPHDRGCPVPLVQPDPGLAVRIEGRYLADVSVDLSPAHG